MPTGYTSILTEKNISFKQFALRCARAFGACISLRDDSISKSIPKFKPDDYHLKALKQTKKEIERITKLSAEEIKTFIVKDCGEAISQLKLSLKEREINNNRFKRMLDKVHNWTPPTNSHQGIKSFMIQQLTDSIDKCDYYHERIKEKEVEKNRDPEQWRKEQLESLNKDIKYHEDHYTEEVIRVEGRNKWVQDLKNSL